MVFGLFDVLAALDAQLRHIVAQFGERLLVQEPGQIVGTIGQQLAAPDTDEQVVKFLGDGCRIRLRGDLRKGGNGLAEIGVIALHLGRDGQSVRIGRLVEKERKQSVELRSQLFFRIKRLLFENLRFAHTLRFFVL